MSWPKRDWRSVGGRCTFGAAYALLACAMGSASLDIAQADPIAPVVDSSAPRAHSEAYGSEQRAEELYLDGVDKLDAGHSDVARQMFETVIGRYPQSTAAEQARRQLSEIYNAKFTDERAAGEATASITPTTLPEAELATPGLPAAAPRSPAWDEELRRNASIQSRLRLEVGDRVFFSAGSADLGGRARMALSAQAQWLLRWRQFEAAIEGHADEPGSDRENVILSQRRAEAVRQRLIEEGVDAHRLAVVPVGRTHRLATCTDSDCRAQNRRAVTLVFASGTRERLGLIEETPRATVLDHEIIPPHALPAAHSSGTER